MYTSLLQPLVPDGFRAGNQAVLFFLEFVGYSIVIDSYCQSFSLNVVLGSQAIYSFEKTP